MSPAVSWGWDGSRGPRGGTFLLDYAYARQSPEVKQQIIDMAMNACRVRATARVLHISPTAVINELKKQNLRSKR